MISGTVLAWAALAVAAAGTVVAVQSANEQKKNAKNLARARKKQADLQAKSQHLSSQRANRIRRARLAGAQALQGVTGSSLSGGILALDTQAANQQNLIASQTQLQKDQFDVSASNSISQANAQIAGSIISFASTAVTPTGADNLSLVERATQ